MQYSGWTPCTEESKVTWNQFPHTHPCPPHPHQLSQIPGKEVLPKLRREDEAICHFTREETIHSLSCYTQQLFSRTESFLPQSRRHNWPSISLGISVTPIPTYSMDAPALCPLNSYFILADTNVTKPYPKKDTQRRYSWILSGYLKIQCSKIIHTNEMGISESRSYTV